MEIVHISDTHGNHSNLNLPRGDVLVHSGDFSDTSYEIETASFLDWFRVQPFEHKILIGGNHDATLSECKGEELSHYNFEGIHYLNETELMIDGLKFYGSPRTPCEFSMAFVYLESEAQHEWNNLPADVDVLITHGPVYGVLDAEFGCKKLKAKVEQMTNLKAHLFGHIHEAAGLLKLEETIFSNAALTMQTIKLEC